MPANERRLALHSEPATLALLDKKRLVAVATQYGLTPGTLPLSMASPLPMSMSGPPPYKILPDYMYAASTQ